LKQEDAIMATDVQSDSSTPSDNGDRDRATASPHDSNRSSDRRRSLQTNARIAVILFLAVIVLVPLGIYASGILAPDDDGPKLTHTITRGDLDVSVTEQGTLESSNNTEIKCKVRGFGLVTWVIPAGTVVQTGDELVRLDTKLIDEQYSLTKTNTFTAQATLETTKARVAKSEIAIDAYEKGRFISQLQELEKDLEAKKRNLRTARELFGRSKTLFRKGYVTTLEVDGNEFTVTQAELELKVKETEIKVLKDFTRKMELETFSGNLIANRSKLAADEAGLAMEKKRRDRAEEELEACIITAKKSGLVIYPSAAAWKRTPDITEGATVRKDQVLLLMPDLTKMQVKVGIHESIIERMRPGLKAIVKLPDKTLEAKVTKVAAVTRPSGWWTGNVVKYDTIIELPGDKDLKPGMSAEVEVILASHEDVITIPVAAVVETERGDFCWVKTPSGPKRRLLQLRDSNDVFIVVEGGIKEGEQVVLNPIAFIDEAKQDALHALEDAAETEVEPSNDDSQEQDNQ